MKSLRWAVVAGMSVLLAGCSSPREEASADLREVSCNFDLKNLQPFLERLPALVESGFSREDAARIAADARGLRVDEEKSYEFPVRFRGAAAALKIRVVMDDVESPDLTIHTVPNLAVRIDAVLKKFLEDTGL